MSAKIMWNDSFKFWEELQKPHYSVVGADVTGMVYIFNSETEMVWFTWSDESEVYYPTLWSSREEAFEARKLYLEQL